MKDETYKEAARILGLPEDEVRSDSFLARKLDGMDYYTQLYECDEDGQDGYGWVYMTGREFLRRLERDNSHKRATLTVKYSQL